MERTLIEKLAKWKKLKKRKPVLIDGARQVGKSYLVEKIFGASFLNCYNFNLLENPKLHHIFKESLNSDDILSSLELEIGKKIDPNSDLIFFDEIGECQEAVNSLKFFSEQKPKMFICASGSNIGLLDSFPVGKTFNLELFPMSFYEFLMASEKELLISEYEKKSRKLSTHNHLWKYLLDYYFVGGMPEAVAAWFSEGELVDRIENVTQIHSDLLTGYRRDFGKYAGKVNALHIENIFTYVPLKLQEAVNDSVKRFTFKDAIKNKNRYSELRGPIDWLEKTKLVYKNLIVSSRPEVPLAGLARANIFKLFYFDLGLLCHGLGLSYKDVIGQDFSSKGFIAENFVQCEFRAMGVSPSYSWQEGSSEIEFLLKSKQGEIFPVEVKSGKRTKAKSLKVFFDKYQPRISLKLIGSAGGLEVVKGLHVWPLYYAGFSIDI